MKIFQTISLPLNVMIATKKCTEWILKTFVDNDLNLRNFLAVTTHWLSDFIKLCVSFKSISKQVSITNWQQTYAVQRLMLPLQVVNFPYVAAFLSWRTYGYFNGVVPVPWHKYVLTRKRSDAFVFSINLPEEDYIVSRSIASHKFCNDHCWESKDMTPIKRQINDNLVPN